MKGGNQAKAVTYRIRFPRATSESLLYTMRHILLHPQLRAALPKSAQRDLRNRLWVRLKSHAPRPSQRHEPAAPESKDVSHQARSSAPTNPAPRTSVRKGMTVSVSNWTYTDLRLQGHRNVFWSTMAGQVEPCSWACYE